MNTLPVFTPHRTAAAAQRRRTLGTALAAVLALTAAATAHAEPAHEHGALALSLAVEGEGFSLDLESPLDNLLGFEHAPRTERQRQTVRAMAQKLRSGTLFVANAEAGCRLSEVSLSSGALPAALLGEKPAAAAAAAEPAGHGKHADHADLDASFSYRCTAPQALRSVQVKLADAFPGARRITVQLATPRGQSQQVLSGAQRQLRW